MTVGVEGMLGVRNVAGERAGEGYRWLIGDGLGVSVCPIIEKSGVSFKWMVWPLERSACSKSMPLRESRLSVAEVVFERFGPR